MKIDPTLTSLAPASDVTNKADTQAGKSVRPASAAGSAAGVDTVAVSSTGATMSTLGGASDFDEAKVQSIRQAIREGRFSVNAEAIADRLISDATALLGPRAH